MNEQQMQDDDRENLSGLDDFEAWAYSMEQNSIKLIESQKNDKRRNIPETQTPF